ncbi:MAG TPA: trypsin-like peptidase domain-containing protein [Thermoguttaceae bacterium]|nr:trypsin-like peptidase domain-containing protein [Thermoguttaceae bacterium]
MPDRPVSHSLTARRTITACLILLCGSALLPARLAGSELRRTPIVEAVEAARPSVVNIRGEKTVGATTAQPVVGEAGRRVNGMGTGVVIDPRGYIITNHHVIDGVREIQVTTADQTRYTATLVNRDPETDLAIIKIDSTEPLPVISIGTSSDLMPGEPVVAVGNAYGYEHTVTRGIISALHRAVQVDEAQNYDDLIQTDASINPGNSGGPLLNIDGEMIGINVAVRANAQGIGFAIPVDKAVAVAAKLLAAHSLQKGWHGLELATDSADDGPGSVVGSVAEKSPAQEAGLQPGDVITSVGDVEITRPLDFHRAMVAIETGQSVDVVARRGDETLNLTLRLVGVPSHLQAPVGRYWELLGVELKPIPTEQFREQHRTRYRGGLDVTAVRPESPAANQGLRRGDVLVGMHVWETVSLKNVDYVVNHPDLAKINPVKFYILRAGETLYGYLPVAVAMTETVQR